MKHFLYRMASDARAPAGDGDTGSWFSFYKWDIEDENFVPQQPHLPIEEGDYLWFVMDGVVKGGAPVIRVENPSLPHQKQEIWYDTRDSVNFMGDGQVSPGLVIQDSALLPTEIGTAWLSVVVLRFPKRST